MPGQHARKESLENLKVATSKRKTKWIILSGVLVLIVLIGSGGYYFLNRPLTHQTSYPQTAGTQASSPTVPITSSKPDNHRLNVLLIGTDTRPGETGGNTDVLMLASIDPKTHRIEMMSIPRDTKVMYPDGSLAKINTALVLGGPPLVESLVEQLTGQPIDNYALTHFGGLVQIIDTLGGITIDVPERMYYNTGDKQYNIINLKSGVQTLNGTQALGFVRFRHDALGDIGRVGRQQQFLQALTQKLLRPSNITKLPTLIREFWGTIDSDMSLLQVLNVGAHAEQYRGYKIITQTLPGSFHNPDPKIPGDVSYWIVNPVEAKYTAKQFFENGITQQNAIQSPSVTENWKPPLSGTTNTTGTNTVGNGSNSSRNTTGQNATNQNSTDQNSTNRVLTSNQTDSSTNSSFTITQSSPENMTVTASGANIRSGPGPTYSIVASVTNGQSVSVIGKSGDWDEVTITNGNVGFIAAWLLSPAG